MPRYTDVWSKSGTIVSAVSIEEGRILYDKAMVCGVNALYVEIGSYLGRTSTILGQVASFNNSDLICVDPFVEGYRDLTPAQIRETFENNMKRTGAKYTLYPMTSEAAEKQLGEIKIDLLFIDGDHTYEGIKKDCELWLPKIKVGGYALFHDYTSNGGWLGVKQAVDEISKEEFADEGLMQSLMVKKRVHG